MKNIAVVFGGKSVEHDISIITALQVISALPKSWKLIPIYIKIDGKFVIADNLNDKNIYLNYDKLVKREKEISFCLGNQQLIVLNKGKIKEKIKIDCAILCNHGHGGEDGSLQGLFETCQIPYTSCNVGSSAVCMDKALTKIMLKNADIDTPAYIHFDIDEYQKNKDKIKKQIVKTIKLPCIVKPVKLGSSVGINICENESMLNDAIEHAFKYDDKIIVEKFIENAREFCCAVVKNSGELFESKVSEVKKGRIFTFEEKYINEKPKGQSKISKTLDRKIKTMAKEVYKALECDGVVRVDFLFDEAGDKLYVNEVNSIPGSLAFNLFDTSFDDLIITLVSEAEERKEKEKRIVYQFNSKAIECFIKMTDNLKFKA